MPTAAVHSALSLSGKVQEYGGWAGFAAVLGLGVLSMLYFAQAREVKRLREWAGRAPERAAELQGRVAEQAGRIGTILLQPARRVVAQPQGQSQPQGQPQPGQPAGRPATPAGAPSAMAVGV